jgi:hypothetical protein
MSAHTPGLGEPCRPSKCKRCGGDIAWVKSVRTGKSYPVEFLVDPGLKDQGLVIPERFHFHKCAALAKASA